MNQSKYIKYLCQFLDTQAEPHYVLGSITIVDFFALEIFIFMIGVFGQEERVYNEVMKNWEPSK